MPSGLKSFLIQYRNIEGRTRRLVLGRYGVLASASARHLAREKLAAVARGEDPSAERPAVRARMSVSEACDWYLKEAEAGRILGRSHRPIRASTLKMDRSRIEAHIKPLLGNRSVSSLSLRDVEALQADIAAGKSARDGKAGRGDETTGGAWVASWTVGTLRSLLGHAARLNISGKNPAQGVRQFAFERRRRPLSDNELRHFGRVMRDLAAEGEHSTGLAAIRLMLLSGFGRMEVLALKRSWVSPPDHCVRFPDTNSGARIRAIGDAALTCVDAAPELVGSPFVFPAHRGNGHFVGVGRVLDRVCAKANLKDVTPRVLRHTFASVARELGFSGPTIAGLLGRSAQGVTQAHGHVDAALVATADRVSARLADLLDNTATINTSRKSPQADITPVWLRETTEENGGD